MTCREFLLHKTDIHQLCAIRLNGWILETVWIDSEDLFKMSKDMADKKVINSKLGELPIIDHNNKDIEIPCLYIDVE